MPKLLNLELLNLKVMSKLVMLRKTDEFSSVFSFRKRFSSRFLVLHYKPNAANQLQIGFVVAKKMAKLAVDRNYMRRVLHEHCRQNLNAELPVDIVIQVQKPFQNADFLLVKQELIDLFAKVQQKIVFAQVSNA